MAAQNTMTPNNSDQLLAKRSKALQDAMHLKQPEYIPIIMPASYMLAEMGGITKQELHENQVKAQELLEKAALEFQPDSIFGTMPADPRPFLILGDQTTVFPGHGVPPNVQYQFVEGEYMKADDYEAFLEDPADWAIRVYIPRVFKKLEAFAMIPPLGLFLSGGYSTFNFASFATPPLASAFQAFAKAIQTVVESMAVTMKNSTRLAALGFPPSIIGGLMVSAPFDLMGDTMRGMRGIMLDMIKRPDQLLAAEDKVSKFQLEYAISIAKSTGINSSFIPLHRGSDGFMSIKQFEKFYWPQLKHMLVTLVDNGIVPVVFYEGTWDQRLRHLAELPKGKTVGWFQSSDIYKVKEILGNIMCIIGGMPNSLLKAGTVAQVRDTTKKLCQVVGKNGGFIMSTGVGEMSGSVPGLVKTWVEATREFGVY
jgi:uroporphyrinogen-III decarboxylase